MLTILIMVAWAVTVSLISKSFKTNKEKLLGVELRKFEGEVQSTLKTYESFSNYIYDELSNNKDVLQIMKAANYADKEEKDILRKRLFDLLDEKYSYMKKYEFRQLHFHLPNTESFLRVHSPDKYGDILVGIRESVRLANEFKRYVTGFEEGKVYNGFRYVYPLSYEGDHIGSVEVSISSASILKGLSQLYPSEDFYFIIDRRVVEESLFDSEMGNYVGTYISDRYYMDKEVEEIISEYNSLTPDNSSEFFEGLQKEVEGNLAKKYSFSTLYSYKDRDYKLSFISIRNITERPVAYLISISQTSEFRFLKDEMKRQMLLVTVLAISIITFSLMVTSYQHRLRFVSQRDYLTKIYNRQMFFELSEKEIKRTERYKNDLSIIMLDIDFFKKVNDTYGHERGDQVLKSLTSLISENIRAEDILARWGGEEFVIMLPQTDYKSAFQVAEKVRRVVDECQSIFLRDITISLGVASVDKENSNILDTIEKADEAMYEAKRSGRNRVC